MKPPNHPSGTSPQDSLWSTSPPGTGGRAMPPGARRDARPATQGPPATAPVPLDLFNGLEVNELDSESVFDRFFGQRDPRPPAKP